MIRNQKRLQLNWTNAEPKSSREMQGEVKLLITHLYTQLFFQTGVQSCIRHSSIQDRRECTTYPSATKATRILHNTKISQHIFQSYVSCIHFESAFNIYGFRERNFLAGTFSILFPQSNCENEIWAPICNQWRKSIRDLVLQQLGHFYQLPWQSHA